MRLCPTCGRRFDELRYQVLAPGLGSFDRVDCASEALEPARRPGPLLRLVPRPRLAVAG